MIERVQDAIKVVAKVRSGDYKKSIEIVADAMRTHNIRESVGDHYGYWLDEWLTDAHSHMNGTETIEQLVNEWRNICDS